MNIYPKLLADISYVYIRGFRGRNGREMIVAEAKLRQCFIDSRFAASVGFGWGQPPRIAPAIRLPEMARLSQKWK